VPAGLPVRRASPRDGFQNETMPRAVLFLAGWDKLPPGVATAAPTAMEDCLILTGASKIGAKVADRRE